MCGVGAVSSGRGEPVRPAGCWCGAGGACVHEGGLREAACWEHAAPAGRLFLYFLVVLFRVDPK